MKKLLFIFLTTIFLASACMYSPQNGQQLSSVEDEIQFWGLVNAPNVPITIKTYPNPPDRLNPYLFGRKTPPEIAQFTSAATPHPETPGWYPWGGSANLENIEYDVYFQKPGERKLGIRMYAVGEVGDQQGSLATFLFGEPTNHCITQAKAGGPPAIIEHCAQKDRVDGTNYPYVDVLFPCGGEGQFCCRLPDPCNTSDVSALNPLHCNGTSHRCE